MPGAHIPSAAADEIWESDLIRDHQLKANREHQKLE